MMQNLLLPGLRKYFFQASMKHQMIDWLNLTDDRKRQILNQANSHTDLPIHAIEKDWWVTLSLKAIFSTKWADNFVFKGGTSLSKSWNLIDRFSEDIDLALDRTVLGFPSEFVSNAQISKLRKRSSEFICNEFSVELETTLVAMGVSKAFFTLLARATDVADRDPQVLELAYHSVLAPNDYIAQKVLIEIGARSLREPAAKREIESIIDKVLPGQRFSAKPFSIETVEPKRTFLEKAFLLHEEFLKPTEKVRHSRLSRHLYDLERLMDTAHGKAALEDYDLYKSIVDHRKNFNQIRGVDYSTHVPAAINFIPPDGVLKNWESDYNAMRESMIYGQAPDFRVLINRLQELLNRFRLIV
jgi:hypothetical protein